MTGLVPADDLAVGVDQDQVGHGHLAEALAEGIHPEMIGELRIPSGDVAGNTFGEAERADHPERSGESLLPIGSLLFDRVERRRKVDLHGGLFECGVCERLQRLDPGSSTWTTM